MSLVDIAGFDLEACPEVPEPVDPRTLQIENVGRFVVVNTITSTLAEEFERVTTPTLCDVQRLDLNAVALLVTMNGHNSASLEDAISHANRTLKCLSQAGFSAYLLMLSTDRNAAPPRANPRPSRLAILAGVTTVEWNGDNVKRVAYPRVMDFEGRVGDVPAGFESRAVFVHAS